MTTCAAADFTKVGGVTRTCWLDEGAITVGTGYGLGGGSGPVRTFAAEITQGMVVVVSVDVANTWANTNGNILVTRIANSDDLVWGVVVSEPSEGDMENRPAISGDADTIAKRLAGKFLRAATVWFPNVTAMTKATLVTANAGNVTPGTLEILKLDVSQCIAGAGIFVNDLANSGSKTICSMHYQAKASGVTVPIMLAMLGGTTAAQT